MSIMSDLADEALKPVKTGLYVGTAVLTVGGLAIAANSQTGRKFLGNVSNAVKGVPNTDGKKDTKEIDDKSKSKPDNSVHDDDVNMINNNNSQDQDSSEQTNNVKGSNNV